MTRQRAEEARIVARAMTQPAAKREMHFIAQTFERLADRIKLTAGNRGNRQAPLELELNGNRRQLIWQHGEEAMRIDRSQANRVLAFGGFTLCFLFLLAVIVLAFA